MREIERSNNDFGEWLLYELFVAYFEARKGKQRTADEYKFEMNLMENLMQLRDDIIHRAYEPRRGIAFPIKNPVPREIFAAPFRDRIVHHFLYLLTYDWWDRRLHNDSYACRKGRDTLFAAERMSHHMRCVSQHHEKPGWIIKLDIQGYFMSLPREKLYQRVEWGLRLQFADDPKLLDLALYLWHQIIFDDPVKGVKIKGSKKDWALIPAQKSLFCQPPGKGIVIGNLTSQLLSNIYLDQLDRFVSFKLGYKHYGRYVDDFYLAVTDEEYPQAKRDVGVIRDFLRDELDLTLHPKKVYMQQVHKGVNFLGVKVYRWGVLPGERSKKNFYKAAAEVGMGYRDIASMASYLGHCKHWQSKKMEAAEIFRKMGWVYRY